MTDVRPFDTRPWVLAVSVTLASLVCCGQAYGQDESWRRPCGLPGECVDAVRFRNAEVTWKLSFDVKRSGVYDIVHWRRAYYGRAGQGGPGEFVAQLQWERGRISHYRVLRHEKKRTWKRLWLKKAWKWRELKRPGEEYRQTCYELARVFIAASHLNRGEDPAGLQF